MEIIELKDRNIWHNFIATNPGESGAEFLNSPEWFDILKTENKIVRCLAVVDKNKNILGLAFLIKKLLGHKFFYWYISRGPIFKLGLSPLEAKEVLSLLISGIKKISSEAIFLKIEPAQNMDGFWNQNNSNNEIKFKSAPAIQPKKTLILDLRKEDTSLLKEMHQKTRYNINLAIKKEVEIIEGSIDDFSEFWRLMELTGTRDGFRIHDKNHYQNLVRQNESEISENKKFIKLFFAQYQGRKIATALVCYFGDKATYLHGASDNEFRNIMAPYLLQWEIIKRARAEGIKIYDFYGIDEQKWPGVTRFKLGFGGEERNYPGVFDIVFQPLIYSLYNLTKKIRKIF
jgi:lipid II:glycine glycyltransferase (peptidoglycan interpeptide bridge formation enzyme)